MYCVHTSIEIVANVLHITSCLSGTSTQPKLVTKEILATSWMKELQNEHNLSLYRVSKKPIIREA